MAVQYAFSQITTTGLKLAVDAADPLSYPGSGTTWTDVSGNGFTGTISSSISFATTNRGALVSSNSASAVSFSGSAADFGAGSFTIEMAFSPSQINGTHWLYSKNSGSFPNFGAYITGSSGSGRITAFYNISSTVSSSATTAVGSIVTGSNYVLDVTYIPSSVITSVYLNSNYIASGSANGTGSLSTSASLLLLNNTTASNSGTVGNLYNFKVYNPFIGSANIRKNYNSMCSRFGLPLALYTPPAPLLLDTYTGAAAAYSLRLLRTSYTGNAIRVRRSSDNTEQDIGFDGDGNLNTGALLTFVGAGNGFVTTWYDQSGNANNATQTTAANQPQIVSNGNIITENGRPTVLGLGLNTSMNCGTPLISTSSSANFSIFSVIASKNLNLNFRVPFSQYNAADAGRLICYSSATNSKSNVQIGSQSTEITGTATTNNALYYYARHSGNTLITGYNSETSATATTTQAITNTNSVLMNAIGSGGGFDDAMQEIVIYNLDNNSNRTGIQNNQSLYYNITL